MIGNKYTYTGFFIERLPESVIEEIEKRLPDNYQETWKETKDKHITMEYYGKPQEVSNSVQASIGEKATLTIDAIAISGKAAAVRVSSISPEHENHYLEFDSAVNGYREQVNHITFAVAPGEKPVIAKELFEKGNEECVIELDEPVTVEAVYGGFRGDQTIDFENNVGKIDRVLYPTYRVCEEELYGEFGDCEEIREDKELLGIYTLERAKEIEGQELSDKDKAMIQESPEGYSGYGVYTVGVHYEYNVIALDKDGNDITTALPGHIIDELRAGTLELKKDKEIEKPQEIEIEPAKERKRYIHLGHSEYDPSRIVASIDNVGTIGGQKPNGLWASDKESNYTWEEWCEDEMYHTDRLQEGFEFSLSEDAKILTVSSYEDIKPFTKTNPVYAYAPAIIRDDEMNKVLDIEKLMAEFDGMEVIVSDISESDRMNTLLYPYDCDSICIWNPSVIEDVTPVREKDKNLEGRDTITDHNENYESVIEEYMSEMGIKEEDLSISLDELKSMKPEDVIKAIGDAKELENEFVR